MNRILSIVVVAVAIAHFTKPSDCNAKENDGMFDVMTVPIAGLISLPLVIGSAATATPTLVKGLKGKPMYRAWPICSIIAGSLQIAGSVGVSLLVIDLADEVTIGAVLGIAAFDLAMGVTATAIGGYWLKNRKPSENKVSFAPLVLPREGAPTAYGFVLHHAGF